MRRTKTGRKRAAAAAAAAADGSIMSGDDRSQAEEVDMELLSSDPEVQEAQLRALDERRGRPAKVRHLANVALIGTSDTEATTSGVVGVMQRSRGRPGKQPTRGRGRRRTQGTGRGG
jgi:hypothetical protein